MAAPVRIVFLGGLGEIGRNCMAIEQGGADTRKILLIDCGLMFPDADMHGIDLVLPDFTYLRENAIADRRPRRHARPRGSCRRASSSCCATTTASAPARRPLPIYGGGTDARARPATASTKPGCSTGPSMIAVTDGESSRSVRSVVEFIPVTHSVPHAHAIAVHTRAGRHRCTRATTSSTSPRSTAAAPTSPARLNSRSTDGIRVLMADSTNAEEAGHSPSETSVGRRAAGVVRRATATAGSSPPASPATCTASSRSPTPRSPTGASSPPSG